MSASLGAFPGVPVDKVLTFGDDIKFTRQTFGCKLEDADNSSRFIYLTHKDIADLVAYYMAGVPFEDIAEGFEVEELPPIRDGWRAIAEGELAKAGII